MERLPSTPAQLKAFLAERPHLRVVGEPAPSLDERPEALLLAEIQALAHQHAWLGQHTWNARGPDSGLQCELVRETFLVIQVLRAGQKLTQTQQVWLDALTRAGVETYCWRPVPADRATMRARLSRKEHR